MTLEDFFTLTEMKDGLTSRARVEELISIMQQQKDCVISNVPDTTRQWSSVACTLAATESKDCLNHFVKLNGLCYLNQWLQETLKCSNEVTDLAVEELLNSLLGSLERLPIYREDSVASGIQLTVEQLVGSKSLNIKEKARALSERLKFATENAVNDQDMSKDEKCEDENLKPLSDGPADGVNPMPPVFDNTKVGQEEGNSREESAGAGCQSHCSNVAECTATSQHDNIDDALTSTENQIIPVPCLNSAVLDANLQDMDTPTSAFVPNSCQENLSGTGNSSLCPVVEMGSSATCCSNAQGDVAVGHSDASKFKDGSEEDMKMEVDTKGARSSKSGQPESCKVLSSSGLSVTSYAHKPERSVSCNFDAKEIKSYTLGTIETLPRSASTDCVVPKYLKNIDLKPDMQTLLSNGSKLRIDDESKTSADRKEEFASKNEIKGVSSESKLNFSGVDTVSLHDSSNSSLKKSTVEMDESSELGLKYGEIDALEVARQVAIEVEREVVDYREPFCSSSPDSSGEDMGPQCSDERQDQPVNEEQNVRGSPPGRDLDDASSLKDDNLRSVEADTSHCKCEQDVEMPEPITRESGDKTDQDRCVFDLNEDICVDESDCLMDATPCNSVNVTAPIVVAASKRAPVLPFSPLCFEGELGWKGSAATSAFRPASPRRTPDVEKTSSAHKRKANVIEFDLNVAESGDDAIDPLSVKPTPVSFGIPREDSAEVSSRRADRLKLDLNRLGDEDVLPLPSPYWSLPHQNGDRIMSPASSSSSRQHTRDFDLNDNPGFFDAMGSHNLSRFSSKSSGMNAGSKPDNPVITIMGSRITERKDYPDETPLSFVGNGASADATAMVSRNVMPYGHIPHLAYGYNGPVMGPPMPFPPTFYASGSIPYMVDSLPRGATVVPQILSTPGLNTASSALPPFLMSMPNTAPGLNGAGTSQSGLDLNSGFMSLETGNREGANLKNFFEQGHHGLMEDQMRAASQPATAGASGNLKESDSGWEPYTFGYKQVTSWQ